MTTPDSRMIILMEYAVKTELAENESDYWQKIGFARTALSNIRKGLQSFRIEHITNACNFTGASADWVLGIENTMFRDVKGKSALQKLKEVMAELEQNSGYQKSDQTSKEVKQKHEY